MSGTSRVAATVAIAMLAALSGCNNSTNSGKTFRLNGSGSSFVNPIMTKWADVYNRERGVEVNYQSAGSGQGVQQMTKRTVHFGCTDAPMNKQQLEEAGKIGGEVLHIPLVMGGVVPAYNVPEVTQPLKFTGQVLADIYTGKITKWNAPSLEKLNGGVSLPDRKILVVYRSEPSGTTYTWVEYLSKA